MPSPRPRPGEANSNVVLIIVLGVVGSFLLLCCGLGTFMTWESVKRARQAARVSVSRNNLKQIGLALHNYHDANRTFPPPGIYGEDGAEYVSWHGSVRVVTSDISPDVLEAIATPAGQESVPPF